MDSQMVKRFLLIEVDIGEPEGSDPAQSVPTIQDWGTYKHLIRRLLMFAEEGVIVSSVCELTSSGMIVHNLQGRHGVAFLSE